MSHRCPCGCETDVPSRMLSCARSWYRVPKPLRDRVWRTYRRGPGSLEHRAAVQEALACIKEGAQQ